MKYKLRLFILLTLISFFFSWKAWVSRVETDATFSQLSKVQKMINKKPLPNEALNPATLIKKNTNNSTATPLPPDFSSKPQLPAQHVMHRYIPPFLWDHPFTRTLLNPNLLTVETLMNTDASELFSRFDLGNQLYPILTNCLLNAECVEEASTDAPYFNPEKTIFHEALSNTLVFLQLTINQEPRLYDSLNHEDLLITLKVGNPEIQIIALELLLSTQVSDQQFSQALQQAHVFKHKAKAIYFQLLANSLDNSNSRYHQFYKTVIESIRTDDVYTVTKTTEILHKLTITQHTFKKIATALCYIKFQPLKHNWHLIHHQLSLIIESNGWQWSPNHICDQRH